MAACAAAAAPVPIPFDPEFRTMQPIVGVWECLVDSEAARLDVRGDRWETAAEAGAAAKLNDLFQGLPESVLDQVKAFYYFPLALVRRGEFTEGRLQVEIKPVSGKVDRAGGIAFGMTSPSAYWVLRLNPLEDNVMLFEYVKARRVSRHLHRITLETGRWYALAVEARGRRLTAVLDGRPLFGYDLPKPLSGRYGLWSKADSRTEFRRFIVDPTTRPAVAPALSPSTLRGLKVEP